MRKAPGSNPGVSIFFSFPTKLSNYSKFVMPASHYKWTMIFLQFFHSTKSNCLSRQLEEWIASTSTNVCLLPAAQRENYTVHEISSILATRCSFLTALLCHTERRACGFITSNSLVQPSVSSKLWGAVLVVACSHIITQSVSIFHLSFPCSEWEHRTGVCS